jgi:hypothetical protein
VMHEPEKSDSVVVAVKPTNEAEQSVAELVEQGQGPRETRTSKARAWHRTGKVCHRRWSAYGLLPDEGRRRSSLRSCTTPTLRC